MPQTLPPQDECITEIQQQWTSTPFEDHITVSQDLLQDPQVNTIELSFNLHFPNITQERINTPPVVHNDRALKEFIQGEERCLKYHNLPDHFHDLKSTLQTEFELLETATSKNIQNIQEVVQAQQAYMTVLSSHITTLYIKLVHLDEQIQMHCIYPHSQSEKYRSMPQIMTQT